MTKRIKKNIFSLFLSLILLDLNEFISGFIGLDGALSLLILLISIVLIFSSSPKSNHQITVHHVFIAFFISFLFLGSLSSILEGNSGAVIPSIRFYIPSLLIYFASYRTMLSLANEKDLFYVIRLIAVLISINAILIVISIFFGINFHASENPDEVIERAVGLYSNANRAGYVSAVGQIFCLITLIVGASKRRRLFLLMYLLCFAGSVSTFSKGSIIISLIIILVAYLISVATIRSQFSIRLKFYVRRVLLILVVFASLALPLINFNLTDLQKARIEQVFRLLSGEINDETTTKRSGLASYALEEIKATFVIGAGLGEFKKMKVGKCTHNTYLLVLGESGIIALLIYIWFLLYWMKKSVSAFRHVNPLKLASAGFCLVILFSGFASHTVLSNKSFIIIMAVIFAALRSNQQLDFHQLFNRKSQSAESPLE